MCDLVVRTSNKNTPVPNEAEKNTSSERLKFAHMFYISKVTRKAITGVLQIPNFRVQYFILVDRIESKETEKVKNRPKLFSLVFIINLSLSFNTKTIGDLF